MKVCFSDFWHLQCPLEILYHQRIYASQLFLWEDHLARYNILIIITNQEYSFATNNVLIFSCLINNRLCKTHEKTFMSRICYCLLYERFPIRSFRNILEPSIHRIIFCSKRIFKYSDLCSAPKISEIISYHHEILSVFNRVCEEPSIFTNII